MRRGHRLYDDTAAELVRILSYLLGSVTVSGVGLRAAQQYHWRVGRPKYPVRMLGDGFGVSKSGVTSARKRLTHRPTLTRTHSDHFFCHFCWTQP
jgi:hypothetical protein